MPQLGEEKHQKAQDDPHKIVSAYSPEGQARIKKENKGFTKTQRTWLVIGYVVVFFAAVLFIIMAEKLGWF